MIGEISLELLIILILTLANGFFAGSEIAIVSARRSRLEALAKENNQAAKQALQLASNPDRFLATVQVGITLIGTFSAAFGGARIGDILTVWFASAPALAPYAESLALLLVVVLITYLSLILGELVPKRLALQNAERLALTAAPIMVLLSNITRPLIAFLTLSVSVVSRLLGQREVAEETVTEEDIVYMVREGEESGAVEADAAQLIHRVFQFTDRPVTGIMTPRTQIKAVSVDQSLTQVMEYIVMHGYSRIPVYEDSIDHISGILYIKDVVRTFVENREADWKPLMRPPIFVIETAHTDDILVQFRQQGAHIAIVIDEYGQVTGLVTLEDLLEELVGEIRDEYDGAEESAYVQRDDGSWLVNGMEMYDKVCTRIGLPAIEAYESTTLAGVILEKLGHIPVVGEQVVVGGFTLEVVDMDGRRVDKVWVRTAAPPDVATNYGDAPKTLK